jgi:hypothetical protein
MSQLRTRIMMKLLRNVEITRFTPRVICRATAPPARSAPAAAAATRAVSRAASGNQSGRATATATAAMPPAIA